MFNFYPDDYDDDDDDDDGGWMDACKPPLASGPASGPVRSAITATARLPVTIMMNYELVLYSAYSLPSHVTAAPLSLSIFCCRLKSHLFSLSCPAF